MTESRNYYTNKVLPENQYWLLKIMVSLGYDPYREGVCNGVSPMAILFFYLNEIDKFDEYFILIYRIFKESLDEAKENLKISSDENDIYLELEYTSYVVNNEMQQKLILLLRKELQDNIVKKFRQLSNEMQMNIHHFLYGIQRCHRMHNPFKLLKEVKFNALTPQHQILELFFSDQIKKLGGMQKLVSIDNKKYDKHKAATYFKSLALISADSNEPVTMLLFCSSLKKGYLYHCIAVIYDPNQSAWILTDANKLPTCKIEDANIVAEKVISAFTENELVSFYSAVYVPRNGNSLLNQKLTELNQQYQFERLKSTIFNINDGYNQIASLKMISDSEKLSFENVFKQAILSLRDVVKLVNDLDKLKKEDALFQNFMCQEFYNRVAIHDSKVESNEELKTIIQLIVFHHAEVLKKYASAKSYEERKEIVNDMNNYKDSMTDKFSERLDQISSTSHVNINNSNKLQPTISTMNNNANPQALRRVYQPTYWCQFWQFATSCCPSVYVPEGLRRIFR